MSNPHPLFSKTSALIRGSGRILVIADGKPDGDAVGSATAMYSHLVDYGKSVTLFCAEPIPHTLQFLDGASAFRHDAAVFDAAYDLILTFDASDLKHGGIIDLLPKTPSGYTLISFDHHATNTKFGDLNVLFTDACSTAEVVYRFFEETGVKLNDRIATSLLTGILTDTSAFSNAATTTRGLEAAGELIRHGARKSDIMRWLFRNKTIDGLRLWGLALERLHYNPSLDVVSTYFLREDIGDDPKNEEVVEGMSNFLNATSGGSDTILVLRELKDGKIKGSLRSIKRDISKVAKLFGGGGHKKAAGFVVDGRIKVVNGEARIVPFPSS